MGAAVELTQENFESTIENNGIVLVDFSTRRALCPSTPSRTSWPRPRRSTWIRCAPTSSPRIRPA